MKTIFLIETSPIVKEYYSDVYCGFLNTTNTIERAMQFESYKQAQSQLNTIVLSDFEHDKTLYLSIVRYAVKTN